MKYNIARLILSAQASFPDKVVLVDVERTLTRSDLYKVTLNRVSQLKQEGVSAGDFVCVLCGRKSAFWIDLLALWVLGAQPICLENDIDPDHGANVVKLTGARYISCAGVETPQCFSELKALPPVDFASIDPDAPAPDFSEFIFPDDDVDYMNGGMIFTSGTTGLPKGIPLSHEVLALNSIGAAARLAIRPEDRLMIATPFRFASSISHFIVTLISGAALLGTEEKLMAADLIQNLRDWKITSFGGSPFHARMISNASQSDLPDLRWLMSSGDHMPVEVINDLQANFPGIAINTVYGMAELGGRFCVLPPEYAGENAGSVGYPIQGLELNILDENGDVCPPNEVGAFYAKGTIRFPGYYRNEAANLKVMTKHGLLTGDMGYRDAQGLVYLSGRSDSVFKRSGIKVSCQVITDAIFALGFFEDAIVLSRKDDIEGHVPVAYIKKKDTEYKKGVILRALRKTLPNNHLPKEFIYVSDIPRTGSGKVKRAALYALVNGET